MATPGFGLDSNNPCWDISFFDSPWYLVGDVLLNSMNTKSKLLTCVSYLNSDLNICSNVSNLKKKKKLNLLDFVSDFHLKLFKFQQSYYFGSYRNPISSHFCNFPEYRRRAINISRALHHGIISQSRLCFSLRYKFLINLDMGWDLVTLEYLTRPKASIL